MITAQTQKTQIHSLFNLKEIKSEAKKQIKKIKSTSKKTIENNKIAIGKADEKVHDVIGNIKMGETIHYASIGEWSMHNLLFHLLNKTGPANVFISTWSVSEDAVRQIIDKIKTGFILNIKAVFDWRVKLRRPEAFELAKFNIADIRLTTCHAKVTIIQNENWDIVVVGSANYTNNPRIEAGVISCDKTAAEFHKSWMTEELNQADPFDTKKRSKHK